MSVQTTVLCQSAYIPTVWTTMYTAQFTTILDKACTAPILANTTRFRIIPSGIAGDGDDSYQQARHQFMSANGSYMWPELVGQTLNPGDRLLAISDTASAATFRACGRLVAEG